MKSGTRNTQAVSQLVTDLLQGDADIANGQQTRQAGMVRQVEPTGTRHFTFAQRVALATGQILCTYSHGVDLQGVTYWHAHASYPEATRQQGKGLAAVQDVNGRLYFVPRIEAP